MAEITDEIVDFIARWGGRCRDCADENGVCHSSGLPCGESKKAIRHVLTAYFYGLENGYLSARPASAEVGDIAALLKAAGCTSGGPDGDGTYVHASTRDVVAALAARAGSKPEGDG